MKKPPRDAVRDEYLQRVEDWPDEEIRSVLRLMLGQSRDLPEWDELQLEILRASQRGERSHRPETRPRFLEHERRLIRGASHSGTPPVWEGLTWVIDLLPQSPDQAVSVLSAYVGALHTSIPDLRLTALADAIALITARFIETGKDTERLEILGRLASHDFELFIAALWGAQSYDVTRTPRTHDGGKDIIARRDQPNRERVYIECQNGSAATTVNDVSEFNGRVADEATRGVFVSVRGFTAGPQSAEEYVSTRPRLSLLSGAPLVSAANRYLGHDWPTRIAYIINGARRFPVSRD